MPAPAFLPALSKMGSVEAILRSASFYDILTLGLVFVHAKDPQASKLLALASKSLAATRWDQFSRTEKDWRERLSAGPATRTRARTRKVRVFDCCGESEAAKLALASWQAFRGRSGLWVLASPSLFPPGELRKCDAFFFFDMPDSSYEKIRDAMHVDRFHMDELETRASDTIEGALVSVTPLGGAEWGTIRPSVLPLFEKDQTQWHTYTPTRSSRLSSSAATTDPRGEPR